IFLSSVWAASDAVADSYPPVIQGNVQTVAVDAAGNRYVTGPFSGAVDFNPGVGADVKTSASFIGGDVFVTRFNSDGTYGWTQTFGGGFPQTGGAPKNGYGITVSGST